MVTTRLFSELPRRVLLGNSLSCGLEREKGSYSIVGSKRALRRGMWHLYTPLVLLPILPDLLFGHHLARLLLATGVLAIVTLAGRGIFSGHVALDRYLWRRISAPDLRSTGIGRRCYTCRLDR